MLQQQTADETEDSFYRDLAFGTGGLRGILGLGTNRMNIFTVRKATQGLANYLKQIDLPHRVAIAYDSRINSELFAKEAACVLAANNIHAYIYPRLQPTPALSWAVRDLQCCAGVCITASHNPAIYNGYKVYGADGCQITLEAAQAILEHIEKLDIFSDVITCKFEDALNLGLIQYISEDTLDRYIAAVKDLSVTNCIDVPLSVVYTPLNGAGLECVTRILSEIHVDNIHVVAEQEQPDGHFPTCPYPNPEIPEALSLSLRDCEKYQPDLLLATDPDCDRVGIAVQTNTGYALLTGNEVGLLLMDYICKARTEQGTMPVNPVAVTTIVSSTMATPIAQKYGVELRRTLTGFKFIGEQIGFLEKEHEQQRYLFGFEESCGYLSGTHVRDKDGVNAAMLICQMARWYKKQGISLFQAMQALYNEFGYHYNALHSIEFKGAAGMEKMGKIMQGLRSNPPDIIADLKVISTLDYESASSGLPRADALELNLENNCKLMIRPSGTESKLKVYIFTTAQSAEAAKLLSDRMINALEVLS